MLDKFTEFAFYVFYKMTRQLCSKKETMADAGEYLDFPLNQIQLSNIFIIEGRRLTLFMNIFGKSAKGVREQQKKSSISDEMHLRMTPRQFCLLPSTSTYTYIGYQSYQLLQLARFPFYQFGLYIQLKSLLLCTTVLEKKR